MKSSRVSRLSCAAAGGLALGPAAALEPPPLPAGLDAYRHWDRWPQLRIGARAYMRSTYDRRGGHEAADASHFLYQEADDFNVTLDVVGTGVLYFARTNRWHGSPWHYEVDGRDRIVEESSTRDPDRPVEGSVFLPEEAFPSPLTWTWSATKGADLMWVPIPFERSLRIAYSRTHYGTGYYIYHLYAPGTPLTRAIRSWAAEPRHAYVSPDASPIEELSSRYEWGPDRVGGKEVFPETSDRGRHTRGWSEFTLRIRKDNLGVLLRRKLDYAFPNQRARVLVAGAEPGARFEEAGTWYLAGSSTCVYSNPSEETGKTQHVVQTSNRRWRDDEFLLPRRLTEGREAIRVRVEFQPVDRPLFPRGPNPPGAWSEYRYDAYAFVAPFPD